MEPILKLSGLTYKKWLPYWWYTGILRLQSIQALILEIFKHQFNLQKGASILMVYGYTKTTEYTRFNFRKLQTSILTYKKGLPYWWYTGIRRLQSIPDLILENFKRQFYFTKRGFHKMVYGYTKTTVYKRFDI